MLFEKLNELFDTLEKEFPYSTMSKEFKGKHHIHKKDGIIILNTWHGGRLWQTGIESEDDFNDIPKLIAGIKNMIDNWDKK
jgi:hypothetical protein